jgi:hypothetical protein
MSNSPTADNQFTPEEQERIRAHIKAREMTFEVFLPESLADWLCGDTGCRRVQRRQGGGLYRVSDS